MAVYTLEYKAQAVAIAEAENFPDDPKALKRIKLALGDSAPTGQTLRKWMTDFQSSKVDSQELINAKFDLEATIERIIRAYASRLLEDDVISETSAGTAINVLIPLIDRLRTLQGQSTDISTIRIVSDVPRPAYQHDRDN